MTTTWHRVRPNRLPTGRQLLHSGSFNGWQRFSLLIASLALASLLQSCTSVHTRTLEKGEVQMSEAEFAAHFERVFRYHNTISNQLINELPSLQLDEEHEDELNEAEEQMNEACDALNEVASLEASSQHADFWTQSALPEAVPECEEATHAVEDLFRSLGKNRSQPLPSAPGSHNDHEPSPALGNATQ